MPTIRFEQEGQQVGCIEGANLRKAALSAGVNPYKGLNNLNNCGGVGQCGTCVIEVIEAPRTFPRSDVEEVYLADRPANYRSAAAPASMVTSRSHASSGRRRSGSNSLIGAVKSLLGR